MRATQAPPGSMARQNPFLPNSLPTSMAGLSLAASCHRRRSASIPASPPPLSNSRPREAESGNQRSAAATALARPDTAGSSRREKARLRAHNWRIRREAAQSAAACQDAESQHPLPGDKPPSQRPPVPHGRPALPERCPSCTCHASVPPRSREGELVRDSVTTSPRVELSEARPRQMNPEEVAAATAAQLAATGASMRPIMVLMPGVTVNFYNQ